MQKISILVSCIIFGIMMNSCKKTTVNTTKSSYAYNVRMTDAPGPYDAVYIDLKGVEVTGADGKTVMLNVNAGVYNLLHFSNGIDTLIATATLDIATIDQIRLILGPNNTIVVGGVSYPLSTPSAEQSGLKLAVHQTMQAGIAYYVLLDFDANKSIVLEGNGTYKLKPVVRTIETALSGAIRGTITPVGIAAFVTATSSVTYSTNVSITGDYLVMGLPAGTYTVTVTPVVPYNPVTINNVAVTVGTTTTVAPIAF